MSIKIVAENRKARFNYEILDKYEAGLVLQGSEVKSIRNGKVNLGDSYGAIKNGEMFLLQAHIASYQPAHYADHDPMRPRKLLLHKLEINKLVGKIKEKGLTLVPLKMYFKEGLVKLEMALGKSKKTVDKRESIKQRENDRDLRRVMKNNR